MKKFLKYSVLFISAVAFQSCSTKKSVVSTKALTATETAMVKALEWQEAHPIFVKSPTDWTNGAYYTGVAKAYESTKNPVFLNAVVQMANRNSWKPWERVNNADDIAIAYSYVYLKSIKQEGADLQPTKDFIQKHLNFQEDNKKDGPLWYWCDALFMAPPVITKLAVLEDKTEWLDAMYKHYKETYDVLYDKEEHLFARDDRFVWKGNTEDKKEKNGKKIFWSRGNGWVLGGLALMLKEMPKNYTHRSFFENLFKEMAAKVKVLQQVDGLWTTSLLSPESYNHSETSGSGFFTFAIAWGINNGVLNKSDYQSVIDKAWPAMMKTQKENGMVGYVQNIGFDPRPATAESWQNYGTGAFLLAGSEVLKMNISK